MKPLHRSTWRTESDCGVQVDVAEGRTTEWAPFREIVVTMDAGMTTAEARRLIADLQHAVALAEEFDAPEREDVSTEDQPKPRVWKWRGNRREPKELHLRVLDRDGFPWVPTGRGMWFGVETSTMFWADLLKNHGPLTEVLADSEQVRHG